MTKLIPVYVDGEMTVADLRAALASAGYMLRSDGAHRLIVTRVPGFLRHSEAEIIPMRRAAIANAKKGAR